MQKFARLFETPDTQVLFYIYYDHEDDATMIKIIFELEDCQATESIAFTGDNQEELAQKFLSRVTYKQALDFVKTRTEFINVHLGMETEAEG